MALDLGYNSFAEVTEADGYFADRITSTAWSSASTADKEKALISASRMINKESFVGRASSATQAMAWPRKGAFNDERTGFRIVLDDDYDWDGGKFSDSTDSFVRWFTSLPVELRYLKSGVYEQALWFLNNTDVINEYSSTSSSSSAGAESTYKIGSIEVTEKGASAAASSTSYRTNPTYFANMRPILVRGGSKSAWFRSN